MKNAFSNDQILLDDIPNNNYNINDNFSNKKNNANEKKEYDVWPEIRVFTYLLFLIRIFYVILLSIYFPLILDKKTVYNCLGFIGTSGFFEIIYIIYSLVTFCSKNKTSMLCFYMWVVIFSGFFIFFTSFLDFYDMDREYFTIKCKVIVLSGSSLIFLLSFIYFVWSCKLICCNEHVNIIFID